LENLFMKKTLVALAVLAASGASFAQATITGSYVFGWTNSTTSAGAVSSGLSTDTAAIQFGATEDLGNGLKASAQVSFGGANRGSSVTGENAFVQLAGGFGTVKAGAMESGQAYDVNSGVGAPTYGFDGAVFNTNVTNDSVTYTLPAFGALSVSAGYADYSSTLTNNAVTGTNATGQAGANGNDYGTAAASRSTNVAMAYAAGGLAARGKYIMYANQDATTNSATNRYLLDVSYDFGVAKVGLGYAQTAYNAGKEASTQTELDVAVPFGALTAGFAWANNKGGSTSAATFNARTGYTVGLSYALSKRTSLGGAYRSYTVEGTSGANTDYRVLLGHSF
jgi:predicted porin